MNAIINANPTVLLAARELCGDAGDTNPEYVRGMAELIIDTTIGLSHDEHKELLIKFLGGPLVDPNGPMTDGQRKALFGAWKEAFPYTGDHRIERHEFTKAVLNAENIDASWRVGGSITAGDADHLLDVLRTIAKLRA